MANGKWKIEIEPHTKKQYLTRLTGFCSSRKDGKGAKNIIQQRAVRSQQNRPEGGGKSESGQIGLNVDANSN
jgi:hypothetical protein